jgi:arginyl-tRNA synthetase
MTNPLHTLTASLTAAIEAAFGPEHAGADPVLRRSQQARFGDYQANAAMALGKVVGRPPREVADAIVAAAQLDDLCSTVEVAGAGFINLTLSSSALEQAAHDLLADPRLGVAEQKPPQRVVLDYSAPNVAKEMHVGHLRSTIIGDALARVLEFLGHTVIRQNHLGDWGRPFGMLIEHLLDIGEEETVHELTVGDLTGFYQQAQTKFDSDDGFADRARSRVVELQRGDEATLKLWQILFDASKTYFDLVYEKVGVTLRDGDIAAESAYNDNLATVADELESGGLARIDQGALCVFPPGFTGREGEPLPLIVRYTAGGFGYAATDLAAIRRRALELKADRIVYVVGAGQGQHHLDMVYEVARMAGWVDEHVQIEHVAFGSVLGADKKMYKTRSGESVKLVDLLDEAVERAEAVIRDKNPDLDDATRAQVARSVGIGAVKYADLSSDRVKDYVFDWDRMLAFEGNTAPYLQYAHARIRSIFRRGEVIEADVESATITLREDAERALVLQLLGFEEIVDATADSLQPHRLCTYLFELAQAFTTFYEHVPVLRADDEATRASRLALCELTARTLKLGLGLLGIESPDRM